VAKLNVLYFDDIRTEREQFEPLWVHTLKLAGFEADILFEAELKDLEPRLARRPHVVIVDNSIQAFDHRGNPRDDANVGARFIAQHKPNHPDTVFVLYTGEDFSMMQLGRRIPNPDLLVTKDYLHNEPYQNFLAGELRRMVRRLPIEQIIENGATDNDEARRRTLHSLIEQIVHDIRGRQPASWNAAKLTRLSGGFSGATVYRLELEAGLDGPSIPTIVKVGSSVQIGREIAAFGRFARWYLPHDLRVDIVGDATVGETSAVCYAFALGGREKVEPLSVALAAGRRKAIGAVNRLLFASAGQGWYKSHRESPHVLRAYLSNLEEYPAIKDDWRDKCFEASLRSICAAESLSFSISDSRIAIGKFECNEIRRALRHLPNSKVPLCICHGDLNSNNIFITTDLAAMALIDFEQTNFHHVFRDFVSLESSVRSLFATAKPGGTAFEALVDLEAMMIHDVNATVSADPLLEQVQSIRRTAFKHFPKADKALYYGALALHLWKLLGFREGDVSHWPREGERHLASGLVAILSHPMMKPNPVTPAATIS